MRRAPLAIAALTLAALAPPALAASRTSTPIRIAEPNPGNATVAGFELRLLKKKPAAGARVAAARLPQGVSVVAVLGKQKRSDRVRGVIVVLRRANAISAGAAAVVTVNLKHAAIPSGYRTQLKLVQRRNVLERGRSFRCGGYFRSSDLGGALSLGGPAPTGLTIRDAIVDACLSARSSAPYAGENELRSALNARSGTLVFTRNAAQPGQLDGSASFNYAVSGFSVLADKTHSFAACGSALGTCQIVKKSHTADYAVFTLAAPAAAGTALPFAVSLSPAAAGPVPFEFFGVAQGGARVGPLLTSGP